MVAAAVVLLCGCARSPEARRDKFMARGKHFLEEHNYSRALVEFKNAAQAMPRDADVFYQLGMAFTGAGDLRSALKAFRRAVELNPKHAGAQLRIAQMESMTTNESLIKEAQGRLQALIEQGSASADVINTLAATELKLGNADSAIQSLERALAQSPGEVTSFILLAKAKFSQNDIKGAEQVLKQACEKLPNSADARRMLGEFYAGQNKPAEAEAQFRKAMELNSNSGPALMDMARLQLAGGRKNEAEQTLRRLSGFDGYKSSYAMFLFQEGRRDEAVREFERIWKENSADRQARTQLIAAYDAAGRRADGDKLLEAALKKNPKDADALLQRGELLIRMGKYNEAEAALASVRQLRPTAPEVHYVLARLRQARGETLTYRQELSEALRLNPNLQQVRIELAQNLMSTNDARGALDLLNSAPDAQKFALPILVQRNWALWALGDRAEMRNGIDRGLAQRRTTDLLIQDGLWKLRSGDATAARSVLEEALKMDGSDLRAIEALTQTYIAQNKASMALEKVKEYAARQPQSAAIQHFLGTLLMKQGDRAQARAAFQTAKAADPRFMKADLSLVQLDVLDGKLDDARKRLETALSANPGDAKLRLWLGDLEERRGNHAAAIEHFRKVVESDPGNAQALNNLAYLVVEHANRPDDALKYAEKAVELAPDDPGYCDTMGWVLYRKGVYSSAVKYLERANMKQSSAIWKYHLAMAYAKSGDINRGRTTLQAALKLNPHAPEAKLAKEVVEGRR